MLQTMPPYTPGEFPTGTPPELTPDLPGSPAYRPEVTPDKPKTPPSVHPDIDPDLPEKPGPPLSDPESPRG
jgi:hypothetical protein